MTPPSDAADAAARIPQPARQDPGTPASLVDVARALHDTEPAIAVAAAMSDAVDDRTRALIDGFVAEAGPPPADFAWMALGSHARRELHCASDQDHALVWADDDAAASDYARELAGTVIEGLAAFGMRRCSGGYMADAWSHSVPQWLAHLHHLIAAPTPEAVVDADIFLDLRPVAGSLDTTAVVSVLQSGSESARLLHGLALAANSFGTPLTTLGRLPTGNIDVKRSGLAPVVLLARLYGLVAGGGAVSTRDRLATAAERGSLSAKLSGRLDFAYALLTRFRLHSQLAQLDRQEPITDIIAIADIPWQDQSLLRTALRSIKSAQSTTAVAFRTDL
jgi:CBS domain-containing protein